MSEWIVWAVVAGVLAIAELLTGTFYLLMLAIAAALAALVAAAGAPLALQGLLAATLALLGVAALRLLRRRSAPRVVPEASGLDADRLDVGQVLFVPVWHQRRARARYRGAEWDVELSAGEPLPGWFRIQRVDGLILRVEACAAQDAAPLGA